MFMREGITFARHRLVNTLFVFFWAIDKITMDVNSDTVSCLNRFFAIANDSFALEHESLQGPLNAVAPEQVTNAQFTHVLGEVLHRPSVMHVPLFALKLAFGELTSAALESQRVVPERALALGYTFRHPRLREALEHLVGHHREVEAPSPSGRGLG